MKTFKFLVGGLILFLALDQNICDAATTPAAPSTTSSLTPKTVTASPTASTTPPPAVAPTTGGATPNNFGKIASIPATQPSQAGTNPSLPERKQAASTSSYSPPATKGGKHWGGGVDQISRSRVVSGTNNNNNGPFGEDPDLVTKVIDINYAHADPDFKQKLQNHWQNIAGGDPKAYLNIDSSTASIYVRGKKNEIDDLEKYVETLDQPIKQVRIDAIILYANRNYTFDLGINWSGIYNKAQSIVNTGNPFGFVGLGGELSDIPEPTGAVGTNSGTGSSASYTTTGNLYVNPANFALNLFNKVYSATTTTNAGDAFVQIPFAFGGADLNLRRLSLLLNAAESEQKVKIVSRPSVLTSSTTAAKVIIGQQLPMQQSQLNNTGGTIYKGNSINYRSVGIQLEVTPTVGADNKSVSLIIDIRDIEVSGGTTQSNADGIMTNPPTLTDLTVTNTVILKSGQTTVIGGLSQRQDTKIRNKIPLLYRIPFVGNLFKANLNTDVELEQFIFITPTIIEEDI